MLVLTRRIGESLTIGEARIVFLGREGHAVRIGIDAPKSIPIGRGCSVVILDREGRPIGPPIRDAGNPPADPIRDTLEPPRNS